MNPRAPHDGLSAYFDGELNPVEQQEIASHLQQSAAAQNELSDIRRLSEEIRSLPQQPAPHDLLSNVMNPIEAGTPTPKKAPSGVFSKSLLGTGAWVAIGVALMVLLAWGPLFWNPSQDEKSESPIASHSPESPADQAVPRNLPASESAPEPMDGKKPARVMLGSEAELLAQKQTGQAMSKADAHAPEADQPRATFANDTFPLQSKDGREWKLPSPTAGMDRVGGKKPMTDPQVAEVLKLADGHLDEVLLVEITAANASDSMKQLQHLLNGNQVSPANFELSSPKSFSARGGGGRMLETRKADANTGLFVQSSRQQLLTALTAFRGQQTTSALQAKTTLARSEIPLEEENRDGQNRRKMASRFGQSLPRDKPKSSGQAQPARDADAQPKKPPSEKAKGNAKPAETQKKLPAKSPRSSLSAPDLTGRSRSAAKADKSNAFQMLVPNAVLEKLPIAKPKPAQPGEAKQSETPPREAAAEPTEDADESKFSRPVRVLFLFREKPKPRQP